MFMEITYCRTHDGETRVRTIEPVGILFSEYYFYLAAFIEGMLLLWLGCGRKQSRSSKVVPESRRTGQCTGTVWPRALL